MQMLASSPDLVAGDLPAFHQRARDAVRFQIADSYVLTDRAGRQILNTQVPYGTSLPMSRCLAIWIVCFSHARRC